MKQIRLGEAILFCPGDRPERFDKALQRADRVIFDLEDSVAAHRKDVARRCVIDALPAAGKDIIVRINASMSPWYKEDVQALRDLRERSGIDPLILLPKAEEIQQLLALDDFQVIVLCETAKGVINAYQLAQAQNCMALFWGGEDLIADLGGRSSRDSSGNYYPVVEHARTTILLAAGQCAKPAIDAVHIDIADVDGLARESKQAVDVGFTAKACIHPSHVNVIRNAFSPSEEQRLWATQVVAAMQSTAGAVVSLNGRMIDEPLLKQALRVLQAPSVTLTNR
ncbi:citrate lyase [Pseudomonas agarici]|uniref:Citrate lyase n=1 Tax=Pseudomonas agarici TaxID=46677 RepID=A0A0X1T6W7_PSEAA|nr:CoA ester lyase [Pseudomonas agarici]AMB87836.1 citrate lyase [Pseudomonas agarici]NWB92759.1 CoA ester lyase [Pseudomonas agarici]NWC09026.1 CoA ester lyase [Pseudomonas agarici]SEK36832.1 citrate lyase subunit beta / citryl-CoA lyase [Pseudomonas agarici]